MNNSYYKTKDLYLASYIYSMKQELLKVERDGRICWFIFEDELRCKSLEQHYWLGKAIGNIKEFSNAIQSLKDIIYS